MFGMLHIIKERVSELGDTAREITQNKTETWGRGGEKNEQNIIVWQFEATSYNFKCCLQKRKGGAEKLFEEIMARNFSNLIKTINRDP